MSEVTANEEAKLQPTAELVKAIQGLRGNPYWQTLRSYLMHIAPPDGNRFIAADGFNTTAAAARDGAARITSKIRELENMPLDPTPPHDKANAEFVGESTEKPKRRRKP